MEEGKPYGGKKITGFPPSVFGRKADARAPFKQTINFAQKLIDVIKCMVPFIGQQLAWNNN